MSKRPVPLTYGISQTFYGTFSTQYSGGSYHGAIDFACPTGTPVIAPDDGEIVFADWAWNLPGSPLDFESRWYQIKPAVGNQSGGGGIMTVLKNKNGWYWILCHLSDNNMAPKGTKVRAGDVIAKSGNTGTSTGSHLHVSLMPARPDRFNGAYGAVDPAPFIDEPYAPNTSVSWAGSSTTGKGTGTGGKHTAVKGKGKKSYRIVNAPTGFQCARGFYGFASKPTGITLHHWGVDGQRHNDVQHFLRDTTSASRVAKPTSAHEVISDGLVTVLANGDKATYHAGSTRGNGTTIGLEIRPEMAAGDVDTLVQRIYDLERVWGSLDVYLHKEWFATACPGRYVAKRKEIVERVNAMHANGGQDPKISTGTVANASSNSTNTKTESFGPGADQELEKIVAWYKGGRRDFEAWMERTSHDAITKLMPTIVKNVWGYKNKSVNGDKDAYELLTEMSRRVGALEQKVGK